MSDAATNPLPVNQLTVDKCLEDEFAALDLILWMNKQLAQEGQHKNDSHYYFAAIEYLNDKTAKHVHRLQELVIKGGIMS